MLATAEANRIITRNLCNAMAAYSKSSIRGRRVDHAGLTLIDSGLDYAAFNAAILTDTAGLAEIQALVGLSARYFQGVHRPWSCWICDEMLSLPVLARLTSLMSPSGLRLVAEHQGMVAESIRPVRRRQADLEIRAVNDAETRLEFACVCAQVFSLPPAVARSVYGTERFWSSSLDGWIGYQRGIPVSIAATSSQEGTIGIYSVGTLAEWQRQGFGEAVTRHAISRAQMRNRADRMILQSTRAGIGLYGRMGFVPASRFSVFITG
jgi:ribosomal protein S18 acetylase RimI-like enzyme